MKVILQSLTRIMLFFSEWDIALHFNAIKSFIFPDKLKCYFYQSRMATYLHSNENLN